MATSDNPAKAAGGGDHATEFALRQWLGDEGLGHLGDALVEQRIWLDVVHLVSDEDLAGLGIALGDRRRFALAVSRLRADGNAIRRQLTVMFCDLVNSTGLSDALDTEDYRALMLHYQAVTERTVARHDGFVARFHGDGVKILFGYPQASEHSATNAVGCGLGLVEAIAELPGPVSLAVSIGVAAGEVVVGDHLESGEREEIGAMGRTVNLAARLSDEADPGRVLVTDTVRRLCDASFVFTPLGPRVVKGLSAPVDVWQVERERQDLHPPAGEARVPLVGRRDAMRRLKALLEQGARGGGGSLLLRGEPGIGKSRLVDELRDAARAYFQILDFDCFSTYRTSPWHPLVASIRRAAGFERGDDEAARLAKLQALLDARDVAHREGTLAVFAAVMSLDESRAMPTRGRVTPTAELLRKDRLVDALVDYLHPKPDSRPVLVCVEDLQWADPSTLDVLGKLLGRLVDLPVVVLMTARPAFVPPWPARNDADVLDLERLAAADAEQLVGHLVDQRVMPPDVLANLLARSDGVPLYLEELTRDLLESDALVDVGNRLQLGPSASLDTIPSTLQDSLHARLDRLAPEREVVQVGAVIGREFPLRLLESVGPLDGDALRRALQRLVDAELLVERSSGADAYYVFRHVLLRDAAYETLLRAKRRKLHARTAHALERDFPDAAASAPEVVAQHLAAAGDAGGAVAKWLNAGELAARRSAHLEAVQHLQQGLAMLQAVEPGGDRDRHELTLQTRLGASLTAVRGFGAPSVEAAYARATEVSARVQGAAGHFSVLRGLWVYQLVRSNWQEALALSQSMHALAEAESNRGYALEAQRALGMTRLWRGEFDVAVGHFANGVELYDPGMHDKHAVIYGNDPGVACLCHLGFVQSMQGLVDTALATSDRALTLARTLRHPFSLSQALSYRAYVHQVRVEADATAMWAAELESVAREHGFPFWLAESDILGGWAEAHAGRSARGLARLGKGLEAFLATGARMDQPRWLTLSAEARQQHGELDAAHATVERALRIAESSGEAMQKARLLGLRAELALHGPVGVDAAADLESAVELGERQGAREWSWRACVALARVRADRGDEDVARELLARVRVARVEGGDTPLGLELDALAARLRE